MSRHKREVIADNERLRELLAQSRAERARNEAEIERLREALVEIRDRKPRFLLPWTHEQAADEYSRMLDADRTTAAAALKDTP